MRLHTFLHISDIHMSNADMDQKCSVLYRVFPKLDGFLGHSYDSLTKLDPFFDNLKRTEDASLIVTGDLTRVGHEWEFETAQDFLENELVPPKGNWVGFKLPTWFDLTIPGNHDRYPGLPSLIGGPTTAFRTLFPGTPRIKDVPLNQSTAKNLLRFLLIDTDADVSPYGATRAAARGSFRSQLEWLGKQLEAQASNEIRVLCLHHSRAQGGLLLRMNASSSEALDQFIVHYGIAVLLSGHIHEPPRVQLATAHGPNGSANYLEARCGTTTQIDLFKKPHYWRNLYGLRRKNSAGNSLLVHRVSELNGELVWESKLFREQSSDFGPSPNSKYVVHPRIRLWPGPPAELP